MELTLNAVFIRPPRVAGASVEAALGIACFPTLDSVETGFNQAGLVSFGHLDYSQLVSQGYVSKEFDSTSFKFAFVRNPYDRAVSWYFFAQARGWRIARPGTSFLDYCRRAFTGDLEPIGLYNERRRSKYNPQVRWLETAKLDRLCYYERLHVEVNLLADKFQVKPKELPIIHWTEHGHYASYYCNESARIVKQTYQEDFDKLGYPTMLPGGAHGSAE